MYIDEKVLPILLLLLGLVSGFGMARLGKRFAPNIRGINRFFYGLVSFLISWGTMVLYGRIPDILTIYIAPMLGIYSQLLVYQAISRFLGVPYNNRLGYSIFAAAAVGLVVFIYIYPSAQWHLFTSSMAIGALMILSSITLVRRRANRILTSQWITAGGFAILAVTLLLNSAYTFVNTADTTVIIAAMELPGLTIAGFILGSLVSIFGFVTMVYDENSKQLERLATHDGLTGVYNRRTIMEILKVASANSRRDKTPLSVLMIDLDDFKQVNDKHGHMEGDVVLEEVANTLVRVMRENDSMGRYGGEEFLAVLPNTDQEGAGILAERVRSVVDKEAFVSRGEVIGITTSIGVAFAPVVESDGEILLQRADEALFGAKKKGRDQVVMAD